MIDFALYGTCEHKVQEILTIDGVSPGFTSDLTYTSSGNKNYISIVNLVEFDGLCLFSTSFPGITNYTLSSDRKTIQFGALYPVDSGMLFPDPNTAYLPLNKYFCTYNTTLGDCPSCKGTKNDFDIHFDNAGRIISLEGHDKVRQQLIKALLTIKGTNLFDEIYGSVLNESIGSKIDSYLAAKLQFSILDCVNHLIDLQADQGLPDDERITSVSDVSALVSKIDPRIIELKVTVLCADYQEVNTSMVVRV